MKTTHRSAIIWLCSLIILCCLAVPACYSKNLLENGDFRERGDENLPKGWNMWGAVAPPDSKAGTPFLRITGGSDGHNGGDQKIATPAKSKQVTLSARIRCPDFAKRPGKDKDHYEIYISATWPDGHGVYFGSVQFQKPERAWKRVEFTAKIPDGATSLTALFQIFGAGTLDVADMKLEAK